MSCEYRYGMGLFMTLSAWLTKNELSPTEFARRLRKPQGTIARYVSGDRIPAPSMMKLIMQATNGQVRPDDFYEFAARR